MQDDRVAEVRLGSGGVAGLLERGLDRDAGRRAGRHVGENRGPARDASTSTAPTDVEVRVGLGGVQDLQAHWSKPLDQGGERTCHRVLRGPLLERGEVRGPQEAVLEMVDQRPVFVGFGSGLLPFRVGRESGPGGLALVHVLVGQ